MFDSASIQPRREIGGRVTGYKAPAHTEREDPPREAQEIIRCRWRASLEFIEQARDVCGRDVACRNSPELRQQVLVEIPARHARMPEPACLDLGAIPVLAQFLERAALALFVQRGAAEGERILTLVELHACGTRLDARLRERHVGIVSERRPVFPTGMSITQRPRCALAGLFA
jgi:hypothetical protein